MDFTSYDINDREKLVVAVFAKEQNIEGIHVKDVKTLEWSYLVLFWDTEKNLLFINSSDNGSVWCLTDSATVYFKRYILSDCLWLPNDVLVSTRSDFTA